MMFSTISGIVSYQTAPSYHAQNSSDTVEASYENGYHTFWGYAKAANGLYYAAGSGSVQIGMSRPHDWTWRDMYAGSPILSASEWNRFCDRINEFREYKDKSKYSFTYVRSGDVFSAYIFNEARNTIESMAYMSISRKYSGDIVYASDFKSLSSALNAIN